MPYRIALFTHRRDNDPKPRTIDYPDLVQSLTEHRTTDQKDGPGFCAATFEPPKRAKRNVKEVSLLIYDFDDLSDVQTIEVLESIASLRRIVYSSYSHGIKGWRFRVVLFPSRPILAAEWSRAWHGAAPPYADSTGKDPSRLYYLPVARPDAETFSESAEGDVIDVDTLLASMPEQESTIGSIDVETRHLKRLAAKWRKRSNLADSVMGEVLEMVALGQPFATQGQRDDTAWRLCSRLAREIPEASPESIGECFAASLSQMGPDAPTPENVADKFARAVALLSGEEERPNEAATWRESRIRSVLGRDEPYTPQEIQSWGIQPDEWLLTYGSELWLAVDGTYKGPFIKANDECLTYLAAAPFPVVKVTQDGGIVFRGVREVLAEHGRVVGQRIVHIGGSGRAYYDRDRDALHSFACPLRPLEPAYDGDVQGYLEGLAGSGGAESLVRWLAAVTDPDARLPLLWLCGPGGVGKSLLAAGLGRLWSYSGPGDAHDALGDAYNDALLRTPLLVAEEGLPRNWRGVIQTERIRAMLTANIHSVNQKYGLKGTVQGVVRLVVTSNSVETLEGLQATDIEAIGERILYVETGTQRIGATLARSFVEDDRIARHVLWLREHIPNQAGEDRFFVGGSSAFVKRLFVNSKVRREILEWLIKFCDEPELHTSQRLYPAVIGQSGRLWVNRKLFSAAWGDYFKERLTATQAREVVSKLGDLLEKPASRIKHKNVWYSAINMGLLEIYVADAYPEFGVISVPETLTLGASLMN